MRIDLYLKKTHIVKRRSLSQELISKGQVSLNGQRAKAGKDCKIGDQLLISLPKRELLIEIIGFPKNNVSEQAGKEYYKILAEREINPAQY